MKRPAASDGPQKARRFAIHVKMEPCVCDRCQDAQIEALQKMKLQVQQPSSTSQPVTSQSAETTEQSNVDMPETPKQQDAIAPEASTYGMDRAGEETEASTTGGTGAVELTIEDDRAGEETEASATGGTGAVELMGAQTEGNRASQVDDEHLCTLYQASRYLSFRGYSGWSIYAEASAAGGTGAVEPLDAQSEGEDTEETLRAESEGEETEGSAAGGTGAVETLVAQSEGEETEASAAGGTGAVETMGAAEEPYEECTKVSLKETCRKYGLRIGGTVQFRIARLRAYDGACTTTMGAQSEGEETEASAAGGTGAVQTLGAQSEGEETEGSAAGGTGAVETLGAVEETV